MAKLLADVTLNLLSELNMKKQFKEPIKTLKNKYAGII